MKMQSTIEKICVGTLVVCVLAVVIIYIPGLYTILVAPRLTIVPENVYPILSYRVTIGAISRINETMESGNILPGTLVIPPGRYTVCGRTYSFVEEGLYRVVCPPEENHQRIVYTSDILTFLNSLAWTTYHGTTHDRLRSMEEIEHVALTEKPALICTKNALFANYLLNKNGITSRVVGTLAAGEFDSMANGHTMVEVYDPAWHQWILFDVDQDNLYTRGGKPLTLIEFTDAVATGEYDIINLVPGSYFDTTGRIGRYHYEFMGDFYLNETNFREQMHHLVGIPYIMVNETPLTYHTSYDTQFSTYYKYMGGIIISKEEFMDYAYGTVSN